MTVDLGYMDTPIYDVMKREEKFRENLRQELEWAGTEPPLSAFSRGWNFALTMLEDALEHGDYKGALAVPDTVVSWDSEFRAGYEAAMRYIKGGEYA